MAELPTATDQTEFCKLEFMETFFLAARERGLFKNNSAGSYFFWPVVAETQTVVYVRPILTVPAVPEENVVYWVDPCSTDQSVINTTGTYSKSKLFAMGGRLGSWSAATKKWTFTLCDTAITTQYFIEGTRIFLVKYYNNSYYYFRPTGTRITGTWLLMPYNPFRETYSALTPNYQQIPTWWELQKMVTYSCIDFLPPEYNVGADIYKKPTFSPGDFFARVTGDDSMREDFVADYATWWRYSTYYYQHSNTVPVSVLKLFDGFYDADVDKGNIGQSSFVNIYGQFEPPDAEHHLTEIPTAQGNIIYCRQDGSGSYSMPAYAGAYKRLFDSAVLLPEKENPSFAYCGFSRKFELELDGALVQISHCDYIPPYYAASGYVAGHYVPKPYLAPGMRAKFTGKNADLQAVGMFSTIEEINNYRPPMGSSYATIGTVVFLIADDAEGELAAHVGQYRDLYGNYFPGDYYGNGRPCYTGYFYREFSGSNAGANGRNYFVTPQATAWVRWNGQWYPYGTIFEWDGSAWIFSADQTSPATVIEYFGIGQQGDMPTPEIFNEIKAALQLMTRRLYTTGPAYYNNAPSTPIVYIPQGEADFYAYYDGHYSTSDSWVDWTSPDGIITLGHNLCGNTDVVDWAYSPAFAYVAPATRIAAIAVVYTPTLEYT